MLNIFQLSILFILGGFLGWFIETANHSIKQKKFINPGFLKSPHLPVYGFGIILVYLVSISNVSFPIKLILFMISTTSLELVTGLFLEKIYHIKLWDYENSFLNYKGIISPSHTFAWLLLSIAFYFLIFPHLSYLFNLTILKIPTIILIGIVLTDSIISSYKNIRQFKQKSFK